MKYLRHLIVAVLVFGYMLNCSQRRAIVIGSKNFSEQVILGELLAQQIESRLKAPVIRKLNLGGTFICHKALLSKDLDIYVEYTGTALAAILKKNPQQDPAAVYRVVKDEYEKQYNVRWLKPLGFNNTFA